VLRGALGGVTDEPVSYVNAPQLADQRGIEVRESKTTTTHDYVNLVTLRGGDHGIGGTLAGLSGEPRIVMIDGHKLDVPPARNMLLVRNDDRPGVIGVVGTTLGAAEVNIEDMDVGRIEGGTAMMVLSTTQPVPADVIDQLRSAPGVTSVAAISQG
jgi:D-3-phosphoglycerate dehydrogenase